jgi:hypothetical protein
MGGERMRTRRDDMRDGMKNDMRDDMILRNHHLNRLIKGLRIKNN